MSLKEYIIFILIIIVNLFEILMPQIDFLKYWDEILMVLFALYTFLNFNNNKSKKMINYFYLIILLLLFLGLIGNSISGMQSENIAIMLDILSTFKLPICSMGFYLLINNRDSKRVVNALIPIAKLFIVISFIFLIVNQFVDLGTRGQLRFGVYGYNFIYKYAHVFSMILLSCLCIISNKKNGFHLYYILVILELLFTLKGISIVAAVASIVMFLSMKFIKKIDYKTILLIGVLAIILGQYQINEYFLTNPKAPRAMLLVYGLKTMITYFPFGAGFATFGSDMANKFYSGLYYQYSFHTNWGTRIGSEFLNDSWWPKITGQFGFLGLIVVMFSMLILLLLLKKYKTNIIKKISVFTSIVYLLIATFGTSIFSVSATNILVFSILLTINSNKN